MTTLERTGATLTVVVLAGDQLSASALAALLNEAGVSVADLDDAPDDAVALLLEPDESTWTQLERAGLKAVLITDRANDEPTVVQAVLRGAYGLLGSGCSTEELIASMRSLALHGSALSPQHTRVVVEALRRRGRSAELTLTVRERQILDAIADGESVKQTARHLGVSPRTIDNTQRVMFLKLGVRNRAHAVSRAHELGLLKSEKP